MSEKIIRSLESLIQQYTGPGKKLIDSQITNLVAPGENYSGVLYKVVAILKNEEGEEEKLNAVAKCLNLEVPDFAKKLVLQAHSKEMDFYTNIVPGLESFQLELGLNDPLIKNIFPKLYAARNSLDENSEVPDRDAVLLFENLLEEGYTNADRTIGFDLEGAQLILKDLAFLQAISIAFRLKNPEQFEYKIKKYLMDPLIFDESNPPPPIKKNFWLQILNDYEEVKPYLTAVDKLLQIDFRTEKKQWNKISRKPFASISHGDLWTNNTMQIFVDEKPISNKLLDFQMYYYDSIAKDVLFFLWTCVKLPVLDEHFDNLLKYYHKNFVNVLDQLGCDITPFSYEKLLKELGEEASSEMCHIIFMLVPLYAKKDQALEDSSNDNKKERIISEETKNRAVQIICQFGKKGWL